MNIIIANNLMDQLKTLDIPTEKQLFGTFSIDDIVTTFSNYTFLFLIIDISAIKDITNTEALQRLATNIDSNKLIFVINDVSDTNVISKMVQFGFYNFATSNAKVIELMNKPNTYKDVAHYHELDSKTTNQIKVGGTRVIGFKNLTKEAGSTSLIYMSKKYLEKFYNVLAVEINRDDFTNYAKDNSFLSIKEENFINEINKNSNYDIIFVDINDSNVGIYCTDIFYLLEPSIIKIGKLNRTTNINELFLNKKIILNKSFLTINELATFQTEGHLKVYFNLPPLNDRTDKQNYLKIFYNKIGLNKKHARKVRKHNRQ